MTHNITHSLIYYSTKDNVNSTHIVNNFHKSHYLRSKFQYQDHIVFKTEMVNEIWAFILILIVHEMSFKPS